MSTVLLAAWATNSTGVAHPLGGGVGRSYMIRAQMAATLAHATTGAGCLATMTDRIAAGRAIADMLSAGARATGPARLPTPVTIFSFTDWAGRHTTLGADNLHTGRALADTGITGNVTIAVNRNRAGFFATGMATGTLEGARIAIQANLHRNFAVAVT